MIAFREGPDLCRASKVEHAESKALPVLSKCSLPHLNSHTFKILMGQGLLHMTLPRSTWNKSHVQGTPEVSPMTSCVLGLNPPHRVVNVDASKHDGLNLLHLLASHRPAHLQHDYTKVLLQVGDVLPVQTFPNMWETGSMIMIGKYKRGEVWIEGQSDTACPEVCRQDKTLKYSMTDGWLVPANSEFLI